jgi:hypothetical protein
MLSASETSSSSSSSSSGPAGGGTRSAAAREDEEPSGRGGAAKEERGREAAGESESGDATEPAEAVGCQGFEGGGGGAGEDTLEGLLLDGTLALHVPALLLAPWPIIHFVSTLFFLWGR